MARLVPIALLLPGLLLGAGWSATGAAGEATVDPVVTGNAAKICFDLNRLDDRGLQGPPNGLRALHYEYCIPDRPAAVQAVAAIDPTLAIQRGSPGRAGCGIQELLCLGHTYQPNYGTVLRRLAELPWIRDICEAFFE
jgi:hypothetical protein